MTLRPQEIVELQEQVAKQEAAIERAVLAERERCAKVAEATGARDLINGSAEYSAGHFVACGRVSKAIRSGAHP